MGYVVIGGFVVFFVWQLIRQAAQQRRNLAAALTPLQEPLPPLWVPQVVAPRVVHGRGLVLASAQVCTGTTVNGRRFEQRNMTIDVEIPGQPPYVTRGLFLVPRGQGEGIPGSSLDISVDPSNPDRLTILGPGGFSGPWQWTGSPNSY